jgi:hypothetical protein
MIAGMDRAARILISAGFIAGLVLLLINDFVLKQAYPGVVTGKLSDFAGLFIFPMFFAAFWPRRSREICLATALAFVWWKSPWSQPAIDGWNALPLWDVARVVDWADLVALAVLPFSYLYLRALRRARTLDKRSRRLSAALAVAAGFAFVATSQMPDRYSYEGVSGAQFSVASEGRTFEEALDATGLWHRGSGASISIEMEGRCAEATFDHVDRVADESFQIELTSFEDSCGEGRGADRERLAFESQVVARLRGDVAPLEASPPGRGRTQSHSGADATFVLLNAVGEIRAALDKLDLEHRGSGSNLALRMHGCGFEFSLEPVSESESRVSLLQSRDGCAKGAPANVMLTAFRFEIVERIGTVVE